MPAGFTPLILFHTLAALAARPTSRSSATSRATNLAEIEATVRDESGRITLKLRSRKESLAVSRVFGEQFRQM